MTIGSRVADQQELSTSHPVGPLGWLCDPETLSELDGAGQADLAQLESQSQRGSAAKAAVSLERFCPKLSMAPVLAIV